MENESVSLSLTHTLSLSRSLSLSLSVGARLAVMPLSQWTRMTPLSQFTRAMRQGMEQDPCVFLSCVLGTIGNRSTRPLTRQTAHHAPVPLPPPHPPPRPRIPAVFFPCVRGGLPLVRTGERVRTWGPNGSIRPFPPPSPGFALPVLFGADHAIQEEESTTYAFRIKYLYPKMQPPTEE